MRTSSYNGSALSNLGSSMNDVSSGTFRDNIRRFLKDSAEPTKHDSVAGFPTWRSPLLIETNSVHFSLYIVEEDVRKSDRPLCDSCRCVGESIPYDQLVRLIIVSLICMPDCSYQSLPNPYNLLDFLVLHYACDEFLYDLHCDVHWSIVFHVSQKFLYVITTYELPRSR